VNRLHLSQLDAIVFDLGGVLLNLDYGATTRALGSLAGREVSSLYSQADQSVVFDRFERGETSAAQFRSELRAMLGAEATDEALDGAWNALLLDVPGPNLELLRELKSSHRVVLLSNTNELHLERFLADFERRHHDTHGGWADHFHQTYYSHLVGMRKPEERIYEHVLTSEGLERTRTLFVDDSPFNVAAARTVGMQALWLDVPKPQSARPSWKGSGLVPTGLDGLPSVIELFERLRDDAA
jgi:putative hydrolase of the HAD superfamily